MIRPFVLLNFFSSFFAQITLLKDLLQNFAERFAFKILLKDLLGNQIIFLCDQLQDVYQLILQDVYQPSSILLVEKILCMSSIFSN